MLIGMEVQKRLYFKNYSHIKKLFNGIEQYYREARSEDLESFKQLSILNVEMDNKSLGQRASQKVALLLDEKILEDRDVNELSEYAKKYNVELPVDSNNKIKISENKDIETLYKVANELFYTSEITNEKRETNSVKKVQEN